MRLIALLSTVAVAAIAAIATPAAAAVVANSLPYQDTPHWTDVVFAGTSMTSNGTTATLTTAQQRGVWFGWLAGANTPAWTPGSNAVGNYLDITLSLSAGARDWSAYFYDGMRGVSLSFNPTTNCNGNVTNCTLAPYQSGVSLMFADQANQVISTFVAMDLTQSNRFEFLLKGNQVHYRINGDLHQGTAVASNASRILVIGDGSGSTLTGWGSMNITAVSFDNAPSFSDLPDLVVPPPPPPVSAIPEPASWGMLVAGFGLAGAVLRRRRLSAAV